MFWIYTITYIMIRIKQNVYHFQDQYYTYTMFDVCGLWCVKYILGEIDIPDAESRNT